MLLLHYAYSFLDTQARQSKKLIIETHCPHQPLYLPVLLIGFVRSSGTSTVSNVLCLCSTWPMPPASTDDLATLHRTALHRHYQRS